MFLTFKDVKFDSWKAALDKIRDLLQEEFGRHQELADSEKLAEYEKVYFDKIRYDAEVSEDGIQKISKIGIAFSGKKVVTRGIY
ncbi:MAG: hypothetical protein PHR92_01880 [Lachnospiraceae bacterium]|nr:hypothetical protein [Lachnospiraceae bacterium]